MSATVPLRRIAKMAYGDALATEVRADGDVPVMSSGGVSGSHSDANTLAPVVVLGRKGTFGSVHWSDSPAFVIDTAYFIDQRFTRHDLRWLHYVLRTLDFASTAQDVGVPGLSRDAAYGLPCPVPPDLEAQRLIADFLDEQVSRIDETLRLRREQIAAIQRRLGLRADELVDEARQSAGWVRLKYRASLVTVGIVVTPSAWYSDQGVPALRGTNIKPEVISLEDLVFLTEAGHRLHRKSQLRSGDVVVVRTGQAGAAAVVPENLDGINAIDILIVRPGRDLSPEFLAMCLNAPVTRELTDATVVGAIQGHFNVGTLRDVLVPDADRAAQDRIADEWIAQRDAGRLAISEMTAQVALLNERKRSLITAAVTGAFDVTTASGRAI